MILTKEKSTSCTECGIIKDTIPAVHGCDVCQRQLAPDGKWSVRALKFTVFYGRTGEKTQDWECCSWKCVVRALRFIRRGKKAKEVSFVSLPYYSNQDMPKGQRADDLLRLLK